MSSSSSSPPPQIKNDERRNWAELPSELLTLIMLLLSPYCILVNAQKVCRSWRRVSKDPSLWRVIHMQTVRLHLDYVFYPDDLCRRAVDRSEGGLVEIKIGSFGTDELIRYIANRSSNLRSLAIGSRSSITNEVLVKTVAKLPLLEELDLACLWPRLDLTLIGHSRPNLKVLKLNCSNYERSEYESDDDDDALAIAESMHGLRHLQLLANRLTDVGLKAILDNCPHLEHLDLRQCLNLNISGDLEKRCLERIKCVRRPKDSTDDYPYFVEFNDSYYSDDYYGDDYDFYVGDDGIDENLRRDI